MNKLINDYNQGFSLKSNDLRFIDASNRLAIGDSSSVFSNGAACILWGCNMTSTGTPENQQMTIGHGAVFYNGEVWHVSPHTINFGVMEVYDLYWCFQVGYDADPAGTKLDKTLVSHQVYQVRDCILRTTATGNGIIGSVVFYLMKKAKDVLLEMLTTTANATIHAYTPATTGFVNLKKMNGIVHIAGALSRTYILNGTVILFTLPAAFRPLADMTGEMFVRGGSFVGRMNWILGVNGEFEVVLTSVVEGTNSGAISLTLPFQSYMSS